MIRLDYYSYSILLFFTAVAATGQLFQRNNTAVMPVNIEYAGWLRRHEAINSLARSSNGTVDLLYIGDSIVQKFEGAGKDVWDHYYAPRHALNLGISGDRTQHVLWRLQHGNIEGLHPKLAIVMIGQNNGPFNSAGEIAEGVIAIVDFLRNKLPNMKILLLAIFQRRPQPTTERPVLDEANKIISQHYTSDVMITYLDVNYVFLRPDGTIPAELMPDYEHPNALGFQKWAEAIEPTVAKILVDEEKPLMNKTIQNNVMQNMKFGLRAVVGHNSVNTVFGSVNSTATVVTSVSAALTGSENIVREEADEIDRVEHHWLILTVLFVVATIFYSTVSCILCGKVTGVSRGGKTIKHPPVIPFNQ